MIGSVVPPPPPLLAPPYRIARIAIPLPTPKAPMRMSVCPIEIRRPNF